MRTEFYPTHKTDRGRFAGPGHFLHLYLQLHLIHDLFLDLIQYPYLYRDLYLTLHPYPVLYLDLYLYLYLYLVGMDEKENGDEWKVRMCLLQREQVQHEEQLIWKKTVINSCCTKWLKQPRYFVVQRGQCRGLYKKGNCQKFKSGAAYGFHARQFRNGCRTTHDIMRSARDRMCKEYAHAI